MLSQEEFTEIYFGQVATVYRVCYSFMKNPTEAEDMVQETFLKLLDRGKSFENQRHEKAWLIVTASNLCKDSLKRWWRRCENLDDYAESIAGPDLRDNPVAEAILRLSPKYKAVVYLYYYEGYTAAEIAQYMKCPQATVRSRLARARAQLASMLGGELE